MSRQLGVAQVPAPARHVPPAEALDAYWCGRHVLADWARFPESLTYFEQAINIDPQFAEAWVSLAFTHSGRAFQGMGSFEEETRRAREAASRALALDGTLSEAHTALAQVLYAYQRDWPASERRYRRRPGADFPGPL